MCLTAKGLSTILCLLATLPVGRRGPPLKSIKGFILLVCTPSCPLCGGTGGGHLRVCWSFGYQSVNLLSFRHHYLTVMWWSFFIPKGVRYAYYFFFIGFCQSLSIHTTRAIYKAVQSTLGLLRLKNLKHSNYKTWDRSARHFVRLLHACF